MSPSEEYARVNSFNCREPDMTLDEEDETQTPSSRDDERHPATGQAA